MVNLRGIIASVIGNIIEWYDFVLCVYLAPTLALNFFPSENHLSALLNTFLIFAIGFLARPLGAIILGHFGDKIGRISTLKFTLLLLSSSMLLTACLPNYEQIGIAAPLLLTGLRLIQGFCIGGEFAGAIIYLAENTTKKNRALVSSTTNTGANLGILCAALVAAVISSMMSNSAFNAYGWRLTFFVGGAVGLIGLYLRRNLTESRYFLQQQRKNPLKEKPLLINLKHHKLAMLKFCLLLVLSAGGTYVLIGYIPSFLHIYLGYPMDYALRLQTGFILLTFIFIPLFAKLSDRAGRKLTLSITAIGYLTLAIPCFWLLISTHHWYYLLPLIIVYCAEQSTMPATIAELFPNLAKYTGISLGYNLTMAIVGGSAPFINTWLITHFQSTMMIAYYLMACAAVALSIILTQL